MKTKLLILALCLGSAWLRAQPTNGEYLLQFGAAELPLYDLSASSTVYVDGISESVSFELTPQGRIRGVFSGHYDDGSILIDLLGKLSGRVAFISPQYQLSLSGHGPISGMAYGRKLRGSENFRVTLLVDPATGVGTGTEYVKVCLSRMGCRTSSDNMTMRLWDPTPETGSWSLLLNLTNRNNRLSGSAQVLLAQGRTVPFRLRGSYSPRHQLVRLSLAGTGPAHGTSLQLTAGSGMDLQTIRGKLFGQRTDLKFNP